MKKTESLSVLIQQLEESYNKHAWHGTNLRGSIRSVTLEQVCWRPALDCHNIWEEIIHCAYWKYAVRRRLTEGKRGSFPLKGSNWFTRPVIKTEKALRDEIRLLDEMHFALLDEIKKLSPMRLHHYPKGSKYTVQQTISGIALHDVYHAGQIQLIKRLQK